MIHCRYGCKMRHDNPGEFEVDPSGTYTFIQPTADHVSSSLLPSLPLPPPPFLSPGLFLSLPPSLPLSLSFFLSLSPLPSNFLGCPMIIKLGCRSEHENDCEYAPVQCPNSSKCAVVQKKDLSDHLKECRHVRCPHYRYK